MASGPMDVEDSIQGKNPQISAESVVSNPEIAAGGGTGAEEVSGTGDGSASSPPPPQIDVAAATSNGAPEENAESARPAIPEVPLVPMPPNFGEHPLLDLHLCSGTTSFQRRHVQYPAHLNMQELSKLGRPRYHQFLSFLSTEVNQSY